MSPNSSSNRQNRRPRRQTGEPPLAVLIVDPDVRRADQLASALPQPATAGFAPSAMAALQFIDYSPPDLIITQLDLPDLAGVDFIARVQRLPSARQMLIMVVTDRSAVRDKIAALRAGADDYLVAPVALNDFTIRVQLLSRFRSHLRR
jgi:DNA-binding response OmpR family regulator